MLETVDTCATIVSWLVISVCTYHIGKARGQQEGRLECLRYVKDCENDFWKLAKLCQDAIAIMAEKKAVDEEE